MTGLSTSLTGYQNLADQFHRAGKLPNTRFVLPTAEFNRDAAERAWYPPVSPHFEDASGAGDSIDVYKPAMAVVDALIEAEVQSGIPRNRIVVGGFSQGSAITILWALRNQKRAEDRVAALVMVAGYVPMRGSLGKLVQSDRALLRDQPIVIIHGQEDTLIPLWVAQKGIKLLEEDYAFEVNWAACPGMKHNFTGQSMGMLCQFLESVLEE